MKSEEDQVQLGRCIWSIVLKFVHYYVDHTSRYHSIKIDYDDKRMK